MRRITARLGSTELTPGSSPKSAPSIPLPNDVRSVLKRRRERRRREEEIRRLELEAKEREAQAGPLTNALARRKKVEGENE
jgi:hypothetical protein